MADTSQRGPVDPRIIRDRLSLWESKDIPKAPLSSKQREFVHDLSVIASERPISQDVSWAHFLPKNVDVVVVDDVVLTFVVCCCLLWTLLLVMVI